MDDAQRFLRPITGSFAQHAASNPAVVVMRAGLRSLALDWEYINCQVIPPDLSDAVRGARAMRWMGFNVSRPHKGRVVNLLDQLTERAQLIRAVNVITNGPNGLIGDNTDGRGLLRVLGDLTNARGQSFVVMGAGGAARAIGFEAAIGQASKITIVNRSEKKGRALALDIRQATGVSTHATALTDRYSVSPDTNILVNATPIGQMGTQGQWSQVFLRSVTRRMVVCDVVANPARTELVTAAAERGCETVTGQAMLISQGALSIEIWTGELPDTGAMWDALSTQVHR